VIAPIKARMWQNRGWNMAKIRHDYGETEAEALSRAAPFSFTEERTHA
jgi:hypothetical protein